MTNPFAGYQPPVAAGPSARGPSAVSGRVKTISIIAIVLGGLGLASTLAGAFGLFVGQRMQTAFTSFQQPGLPPAMRDAQTAMQTEMQTLQERFRPATIGLLIGHFAVSAALLAGGIMTLRRTPRGRRLLVGACLITALFEIVRGIVQALLQVRSVSAAGRYMQRVVDSTGDRAGVGDTVVTMFRFFTAAAVVIGAVLILAQLAFYIYAFWFLRKPAVQAYFEEVQVL